VTLRTGFIRQKGGLALEEKRLDQLPIDARLLTEAVIELNISRKSVGLYPPDHHIIKGTIKRAFGLLERLFELRNSITLGASQDTLVIDQYSLDRKNPVFSEFARSILSKNIAGIIFRKGLTVEELFGFHELVAMRGNLTGKACLEDAERKELRHIELIPIDFTHFGFMPGNLKPGDSGRELWETYLHALFEGRLTDNEAEDVVLNVSPEQVAVLVNSHISEESPEETYERVITSYLRKKGRSGFSGDAFNRFMSFVQNLTPDLKSQFLKRTFLRSPSSDIEIESILNSLKEDDIVQVLNLLKEQSLRIPETLVNIMTKLTAMKAKDNSAYGLSGSGETIEDDMEIDENIIMFLEDGSKAFVSERYQKDLERMIAGVQSDDSTLDEVLDREYEDKVIDSIFSETVLELLESDLISREDYLKLLTKLSELANAFLETGRFRELCEIYNVLYSQSMSGNFKTEAHGMLIYYLQSEQFVLSLVETLKLWGKHDMEGAVRLARVFKYRIINPLLDALSIENESSARSLLLSIIVTFGTDIIPEALKRLKDGRWYVVRNMIYLLRICGGKRYRSQYLDHMKKLARDENIKIRVEAVRTLLECGIYYGPSFLNQCLRSKNLDLRQNAIVLSRTYGVKEAVPYLIELLEKKDLLGTESFYKMAVVKALGAIGDPKAIEPLMSIYKSRAILYKGLLEELKEEIFKNIQGYPRASIGPLLELGIKSRNNGIRAICEQFLNGTAPLEDTGQVG